MSTYWRGVLLDERTAAMMQEVDGLTPETPLDATQGSYSGGVDASAGTHSGCGAIDLAAAALNQWQRDNLVQAMRQVGFAAWLRTPAQSDWPYHVHAIAVQPGGKHDRGCLAGAAHDQVIDYYEGRNGLASNAPDDGPRQYVGTTWETYQESTAEEPEPPPPPPEEDDMIMVLVQPDGGAWVVDGPRAWGVGSGDALKSYQQAGVAVVNVTKAELQAALVGRTVS